MLNLQIANLLANLSVAAAGLLLAWAMLRIMDLTAGVDFTEDVIEELERGNFAVGVYYGLRVLGVMFIVGLCLSRVPV